MAGKLLTVRLDGPEHEVLAASAKAAGMPVSKLVRAWIATLGNQTSSEGAAPAATGDGVPTVREPGPLAPLARPSFLVAPDDDCLACGHDRQTYHLGANLVCVFPIGRQTTCACPAFVEAF